MSELVQVFGALMILGAFVGVQTGRVEPTAPTALVLNTVGGAILASLAFGDRQWGFVLLEGVWALVAVWGLVRVFRTIAESLRANPQDG